jgi:lysophospholipase L1-like esterase
MLLAGCSGSNTPAVTTDAPTTAPTTEATTLPPLSYEGMSAVFVGDSITYGVGTTNGNRYFEYLAESLGLGKIYPMGVSGSCYSTCSERGMDKEPLTRRAGTIPEADLIFILMGTNDMGRNTPLGTPEDTTDVSFYGAIHVVVSGLQKKYPDSKIILLTPVPRRDLELNKLGLLLTDYVEAVETAARMHNVPCVDMYKPLAGYFSVENTEKYFPDLLHPNAAGHQLMADVLEAWLLENIDTILN